MFFGHHCIGAVAFSSVLSIIVLLLDHKTEDFYTESVLDSNPKMSCFYIIA